MINLESKKLPKRVIDDACYLRNLKNLNNELTNHLSRYPGNYRCQEACNSEHNESYRKWVNKKMDIQVKIEVYSKTKVKTKNIEPCIENKPPERIKRTWRKTVDTYYRCYMESLQYMKESNPDTIEWRREASRARNLRFKIIRRAEEDGVSLPNPLPKLPEYNKYE